MFRAGSPPQMRRVKSAPPSQKASPREPQDCSGLRFKRAVAEAVSSCQRLSEDCIFAEDFEDANMHDYQLIGEQGRRVRPLTSRQPPAASSTSQPGMWYPATPRSMTSTSSRDSRRVSGHDVVDPQIAVPQGLRAQIIAGTPSALIARWLPMDMPAQAGNFLLRYEVEVELFGGASDRRIRSSKSTGLPASGVVIVPTRGPSVLCARYEPVVRGQSCKVRVRAVAKLGTSLQHGPWSSHVEVSEVTGAEQRKATSLGSPTELSVQCTTPAGSDPAGSELSVSWRPAKQLAGRSSGRLAGYRVYWIPLVQGTTNTALLSKSGSSMAGANFVEIGMTNHHVLRGLKSGTVYTVFVAGVTEAGLEGPCSERVLAWTVPTRPGAPQVPEIYCNAGKAVLLRWSPPDDDGGPGGGGCSHYEVRVLPMLSASSSTLLATNTSSNLSHNSSQDIGDDSSIRISDGSCELCFGVWQGDQQVEVRAVNSLGAGPWSSPISASGTLQPGAHQDVSATDLSWSSGMTAASPEANAAAEWPKPLRVVEVLQTSITLGWNPEALGNSSDQCQILTLQHLDSLASEPQIIRTDDVSVEEGLYRSEDLACNAAYSFKVRRTRPAANSESDADLDAEYSEATEVIVTAPGLPLPPPTAPQVSKVHGQGSQGFPTRAALSWLEPISDGGMPILHYQVVIQPQPSSSLESEGQAGETSDSFSLSPPEMPCPELEASWTELTVAKQEHKQVTDLKPDAVYRFAVRAITAIGGSDLSEWSQPYRTGPSAPAKPGVPWLLGPSALFPHEPQLSFALPAGEPKHYRCLAVASRDSTIEGASYHDLSVVSSDDASVTAVIHKLDGNRTYKFSVQAENEGGWGLLSEASKPGFVWQPLPPGKPEIYMVMPDCVFLKWYATLDQDGELIENYNIHTATIDENTKEEKPFAVEPVKATVNQKDLRSAAKGHDRVVGVIKQVYAQAKRIRGGNSYVFRMEPAAGAEPRLKSEASEEQWVPLGKPGSPSRPTCGQVSNTPLAKAEVELSWCAPDSDGGDAIMGYRIFSYRLAPGIDLLTEGLMNLHLEKPWVYPAKVQGVGAFSKGGQNEKTPGCIRGKVKDLDPGASYCFQVTAMNGQGHSQPSPLSEVLQTASRAPSACRALLARAIGSSEVQLSWQPPASCGGAEVSEYEISVHSTAQAPWHEKISAQDKNPVWIRHVVAGLRLPNEYHFQVAAVNEAG
eukprot:CAMPEP_0178376418 /NCGR_PEP_ID=MMETSP0689_2-20121128/3392_1 /TAXON_ID=160604 /ORGANISM="Amphidinium massartii, Strain CS-259" /LENGTH=1213 /DNA_ID=CAMNT_0019996439 /DNA_START=59 /DNA_END=3697 /DNA_ORIENTATION=+